MPFFESWRKSLEQGSLSKYCSFVCAFATTIILAQSTDAKSADASTWRDKPIPERNTGSALTYHDIPVDLFDPRSKEKMVEVSAYGVASESFYARKDKLNAPYFRSIEGAAPTVRCRETVARMLQKANEKLQPLGIELFVLDGFRSIECQTALWNFFMKQAALKLPGASQKQLVEYAGKYCSNPTGFTLSDPRTWTTHVTGGAVDLTLRRKGTGELLYMGGVFDDPSDITSSSYYEKHADSLSAQEAQKNRRLLYWAMTESGFTNYPSEWWHFDYGDQMWVQNTSGAKRAWYGPAIQTD